MGCQLLDALNVALFQAKIQVGKCNPGANSAVSTDNYHHVGNSYMYLFILHASQRVSSDKALGLPSNQTKDLMWGDRSINTASIMFVTPERC